jgi:hypothetical protein
VIANPLPVADIGTSYGIIYHIIVEPANLVSLPLHHVGVLVIRNVILLPIPFTQALRSRVPGSIQGSHNQVWLFPGVFHNDNFSAVWPVAPVKVCPEHPEGRPQPCPSGNLGARFNSPVLKRLQALGFEPGDYQVWIGPNSAEGLKGEFKAL